MTDKGADESKIKAIGEMLDTEMGHALISALLGYGLTYAPKIGEDPRVQRLAGEFRVNGMATAGNVLMEAVMSYVLPSIMSTLSSLPLPEVEQVRVAEKTVNTVVEVDEEETGGSVGRSVSA
jgi:hypothetical protein